MLPVAAEASRYHAGEIIAARYRLEELVRADELCEMWRASRADVRADFEVTLKILRRPESFPDPVAYESRAAAIAETVLRLAHPNLERVLDHGVTDHEDPWLCCEHIEGETLASYLRRKGHLSPRHTAQILLPVIEALQAAHAAGVIHGDLTADRITLARRPHAPPSPRLCDLGVVVAGTDELFDVWAISNVASRMVSADRETSESAAESDDAFDGIVARGLHADPAHRWQSARDLGKALAIWLIGHDVDEDVNGVSLYGRWFNAALATPLATEASTVGMSSAPPSVAPLAVDPVDAPVELPRRRFGGWVAAAGGVGLLAIGALLLRDVIREVPNSSQLVAPEVAAGLRASPSPVESTTTEPASEEPPPSPTYEEQTMAGAATDADAGTPPPPVPTVAVPRAPEVPSPSSARPAPRTPTADGTVVDAPPPPTPAAKPSAQPEPDPREPTGGAALEPAIPFHGEPVAPPPPPPPAPPLEHTPVQI